MRRVPCLFHLTKSLYHGFVYFFSVFLVFIKKIYALKNRLLKNFNDDISQKFTFEASIIIKNINKKSQILFITNTIDYIFWDNAKLNIKLKNCNQ